MRLPRPARPSAWTLRTKLVASVVALFLGVMLLTGALTVLASRAYLTAALDRDLVQTVQRLEGGRRDVDGDGPGGGPPPGSGNRMLQVWFRDGQVVRLENGLELNYVVDQTNTLVQLSQRQLDELLEAELSGTPETVDLGGRVGSYRLVAASTDSSAVVVVGLPTTGVDAIVGRIVALVAGGTLLGLVAVGLGGTYLVRRTLEPLTRVAATAGKVSTLRLDSGTVDLHQRVPAVDTDPRTEVGQVGLALNHLLDNVEGALQARQESETRVRQFVADASHELRTPLASIRGYAELSRRVPDPVPPTVSHALGRVESEALRMQGLVEDLLLLARLDSGRPLERDLVDLSLLAVDVVGDAHAAAPDHRWELDLPDEPVEVPGDRARLHQVLANLLANARAHTPPGTRVVTSVRPEGDHVRLSVHDDGPGIPTGLQPQVFERFTRGDDSRSRGTGSTGLGLSIVAAVGQAHGGRVELTSGPGNTTVSVLLPAHPVYPATRQQVTEPPAGELLEGDAGAGRGRARAGGADPSSVSGGGGI
ncbi:MAG TPA: ATP-binding protein [Dermatophilaceae bacterium]|nr:ATP-binding protein [Dermatophilaceae bacterium]